MAKLKAGFFALAPDGMGVGKVLSIRGRGAELSFFHSITNREIHQYPLQHLNRYILNHQTRVYAQDDGRWKVGRVVNGSPLSDGAIEYEIQFPNRHISYMHEEDLEIRCLRPLCDPTEVLACGGIETQFFHERRNRLLNCLVALRSASHGLAGLLSSSIEFVPHQVEVIRRVLEDPLQRYLLADEVGMGKTIEAGVIIRQCLLDNPNAEVIILAPSHLVSQWQRELKVKFGTEQLIGSVVVLPFEEAAHPADAELDLLVIDEAHHLVGAVSRLAPISKSSLFEKVKQLALKSRRLLLLSATPVLGHEETLLAMLQLLDPSTYHLEDLPAFKEKVQKRQEYGRLLLGLRDDASSFVLRQRASKALEMFHDDPVVADLAPKLVEAAKSQDSEAISEVCSELRLHIAETYRIHHRLIRTRRVDTQGWEFRPRGPGVHDGDPPDLSHVQVEVDTDERMPILMDLLEQWREASFSSGLSDDENHEHEMAQARRYVQLFDAIGGGVHDLQDLLDALLRESDKSLAFDGEVQILEEMLHVLRQDEGGGNRYHVATDCLTRLHRKLQIEFPRRPLKVVVFCSSSHSAQLLREHLTRVFGKEKIHGLFEAGTDVLRTLDDSEEDDSPADRFLADENAWIIVCDRNGEEGLNFHFAQAIVHFDIPFSPARIEQRIGRLDRFGRKYDLIRHVVFMPSDKDYSPWYAWYKFLALGFQIFNNPTSDVQFLLERVELELILEFYRLGLNGLLQKIEPFRSLLRDERQRLDEQYALDSVAMGQGDAQNFFDELETAEEDEEELKTAIDEWLFNVMQFNKVSWKGSAFSLEWTQHTLVPRDPWKLEFTDSFQTRLTYRRNLAVRERYVCLVRPGSPLINTLDRFLRWDDRGTAFATWRMEPSWRGRDDLWTGFRLSYLVEADLSGLVEGLFDQEILAGLQRRADGLLPPWMATLYIDSNLEEVSDATIRRILDQPYDNRQRIGERRDYNLGSRTEALYDVIDPGIFQALCRRVREVSEERLRESPTFKEWLSKGASEARRRIERYNRRLLQRREALSHEFDSTAGHIIDREIELNHAMVKGIEEPMIRLDAIGFFIIAGLPPQRY